MSDEYHTQPDVPKGWYAMPDGRHRYWDGEGWTEKFTTPPPSREQRVARTKHLSWLAWLVALAIVMLLALATVRILHLEDQQARLYDQIRQNIENVGPPR